MLIPMTVIVLEVVPLIFQRIEGLIFDAPPRSPASHELIHGAFVDAQVRHPAEMLDLVSVPLPALQKIDAQVSIGLIERHIPYEPKRVAQPCLGILPVVREHPSSSFGCGYVLKHV